MTHSPTLLQFGTGKFLRAFVDLFVAEANRGEQPVGAVVAVQSTGSGRSAAINRQAGRYSVAVRGLQSGVRVDRIVEVDSLQAALGAAEQWDEVLQLARSAALAGVVSNATEAAYNLEPDDRPEGPRSFPARLLAVFQARFEAGHGGLTILPCELIERNAERLRDLVLQQAALWKSDPSLVDWIQRACSWRNTLVDRIVSSPLPDEPLAADPLSAVAEPFAFWAIERATDSPEPSPKLKGLLRHPAVQEVDRLEPYHLRKVRILNGAHTALVAMAMPLGIQTVREAIENPQVRAWLERLLFDEIVPVLEGRTDNAEGFARQTLERFANPFLEHRLADIALHHAVKLQTRLAPTLAEFRQRFGRSPEILSQILEGTNS